MKRQQLKSKKRAMICRMDKVLFFLLLAAMMLTMIHANKADDDDDDDDENNNNNNKNNNNMNNYYDNNNNNNPRIVGGTPVVLPTDFSFFAHPDNPNFACGGTLIARDMILTAAHCYNAFAVGRTVYIGGVFKDGSDALAKTTVARLHPHPRYNSVLLINDIMLVELLDAVDDESIPLAKIMVDQENDDVVDSDDEILANENSQVTAIGIGLTSVNSDLSPVLLQVDLHILNLTDCQAYWSAFWEERRIVTTVDPNIQFCAGNITGGTDTCNGDSGGPLLWKKNTDTTTTAAAAAENWIQIGITSGGEKDGCGVAGRYPFYTRISAYKNFIIGRMCDFSTQPSLDCSKNYRCRVVDGDGDCNFLGFFPGFKMHRPVSRQEAANGGQQRLRSNGRCIPNGWMTFFKEQRGYVCGERRTDLLD